MAIIANFVRVCWMVFGKGRTVECLNNRVIDFAVDICSCFQECFMIVHSSLAALCLRIYVEEDYSKPTAIRL